MVAWSQNEVFLKRWLIKRVGDLDQAEDLLQDVFIKALLNKERFCELEHAQSWLMTMTKNVAIDAYRKQARYQSLYDEPEQPGDDTEEEPVIASLEGCMRRVLNELDVESREVIESCDIRGLSQGEFAIEKGISLVAAKSRIQRARKKLRSQMVNKCQIRFDDLGVSGFTPRIEKK